MSAIVIQADTTSNKLFTQLAKKLGGNVLFIDDEQYEDIALGALMTKEKTNKLVSRKTIMDKLDEK